MQRLNRSALASEVDELRTFWSEWKRAIVGVLGFNLYYRFATGKWLVFKIEPRPKRRRRVR